MSQLGFWNFAQKDPERLALVTGDGRERSHSEQNTPDRRYRCRLEKHNDEDDECHREAEQRLEHRQRARDERRSADGHAQLRWDAATTVRRVSGVRALGGDRTALALAEGRHQRAKR